MGACLSNNHQLLAHHGRRLDDDSELYNMTHRSPCRHELTPLNASPGAGLGAGAGGVGDAADVLAAVKSGECCSPVCKCKSPTMLDNRSLHNAAANPYNELILKIISVDKKIDFVYDSLNKLKNENKMEFVVNIKKKDEKSSLTTTNVASRTRSNKTPIPNIEPTNENQNPDDEPTVKRKTYHNQKATSSDPPHHAANLCQNHANLIDQRKKFKREVEQQQADDEQTTCFREFYNNQHQSELIANSKGNASNNYNNSFNEINNNNSTNSELLCCKNELNNKHSTEEIKNVYQENYHNFLTNKSNNYIHHHHHHQPQNQHQHNNNNNKINSNHYVDDEFKQPNRAELINNNNNFKRRNSTSNRAQCFHHHQHHQLQINNNNKSNNNNYEKSHSLSRNERKRNFTNPKRTYDDEKFLLFENATQATSLNCHDCDEIQKSKNNNNNSNIINNKNNRKNFLYSNEEFKINDHNNIIVKSESDYNNDIRKKSSNNNNNNNNIKRKNLNNNNNNNNNVVNENDDEDDNNDDDVLVVDYFNILSNQDKSTNRSNRKNTLHYLEKLQHDLKHLNNDNNNNNNINNSIVNYKLATLKKPTSQAFYSFYDNLDFSELLIGNTRQKLDSTEETSDTINSSFRDSNRYSLLDPLKGLSKSISLTTLSPSSIGCSSSQMGDDSFHIHSFMLVEEEPVDIGTGGDSRSSVVSKSSVLTFSGSSNNNPERSENMMDSSETLSKSSGDELLFVKEEREVELIESDPTPELKCQTSVTSPNERLKLQSIVEAVGFIMFPSASYANMAFKQLLIENNLLTSFENSLKTEYKRIFDNEEANAASSQKFAPPCDELMNRSLKYLLKISNLEEEKIIQSMKKFQKRLGYLYFKCLYDDFERALRSIGCSMFTFFNNLNSLQESLINHAQFGPRFLYLHEKFTGYSPSFRCDLGDHHWTESASEAKKFINIYMIQERTTSFVNNFYAGLIESAANYLWNLEVKIEKIKNTDLVQSLKTSHDELEMNNLKHSPYILGYRVKLVKSKSGDEKILTSSDNFATTNSLSSNPKDLCINLELLKATFPFIILIDRTLTIKQVGDGLIRHLGHPINHGYGINFLTYFTIITPKLNEYTFNSILINHNMSYRLKMKVVDVQKASQLKDMELKGSISYLEESDCLIFIGSPVIQHLEELTSRDLYISDIPIHDATRDIILVGEQTKAQEGLKFRMEKLKKSIVQAHSDIEEEKRKNIEILNLIFPSEIAKKLWRGEKVVSRSVTNVTLLYSDIVGFTSICSTSQPIEIIEMLKRLYTDFDNYCGLIDIYKIETIGDAYVAAGGLHKPSQYHALQIAWMSLLMMDSAAQNHTPKGNAIKIRVGLHTGDVLAGIVGVKQPRYCLFGNNCTIANKYESLSEEKRVHVSPTTKTLLDLVEGFSFERRDPSNLPDNWIKSSPDETSWFLNSYRHKNVNAHESCLVHVKAALNEYKMGNFDVVFN